MAMSKKEREAFAELERNLRITAALRWTEKVAPDVPRPERDFTSGYTFNAYSQIVDCAWSTPGAHGIGHVSPDAQRARGVSGRQNSISLYSSRLLALRAMRYELEMECAIKLAKVDAEIAAELATPKE